MKTFKIEKFPYGYKIAYRTWYGGWKRLQDWRMTSDGVSTITAELEDMILDTPMDCYTYVAKLIQADMNKLNARIMGLE